MKIIKNIYKSANGTDDINLFDNGMYVRDVLLDLDIGEEIIIGHFSDLHFNYCNEQDFAENDPVLMSTYKNRIYFANGETAILADKCFDFFKDTDQVIVNGDTLDYLSFGNIELMQKEIWDKHPNALATLGGHEFARNMQGEIPDTTPWEEKAEKLQAFWPHDIFYFSRVIKEKIMVIGLLNDWSRFYEGQKEKLEKDIALSRKNGYKILLFAHEPIASHLEKYSNFTVDDLMLKGYTAVMPIDFGNSFAGRKNCDPITREVYSLIINNADIIKAFFAGHLHNDLYLEIGAKNPDGSDTVIPQYVNYCACGDLEGHVMRITIK